MLTSHDDKDLIEAGYATGVSALVAQRAEQARLIGVDGLVCSGEEVAKLRAIVGPKLALVTPGIRPAGSDPGEQHRPRSRARLHLRACLTRHGTALARQRL